MSDKSKIQWTDATWNPTTGCTKVSPGCAHCYIERTPAFRINGRQFVNGMIDMQLHENRLAQPLHWKKPRRVFVNSLSDLFHEDVPASFIADVFATMHHARQHVFQILTKRPERMRNMLTGQPNDAPGPWPLPNVWLGVSVENQHFADERIPLLLQTPAAVRFISAEPLLGPIDLLRTPCNGSNHDYLTGEYQNGDREKKTTPRLDWVIVGGESGPESRQFDISWGRSLVAQCKSAGVPVFVKQLGANPWVKTANHYGPGVDAAPYNMRYQLRDKKGGDMNEWPDDLRVREMPI